MNAVLIQEIISNSSLKFTANIYLQINVGAYFIQFDPVV